MPQTTRDELFEEPPEMITARYTRRATLAGLATAVAIALSAGGAAAAERLNVVATTGMIADAARQVGGDLVQVEALMGPGVDPHAYRQTRSDIIAMTRADLVLRHGLYLEAQLQDFLMQLAEDRAVVAVADDLPREVLIAHDTYADKFDPHVWMNPVIWADVVANVRDALIAAQPDAEAAFRANADAHLVQLAALAEYTETVLSSVPPEARVLLTSHDAFRYFGARYGFEVVGIQGISTESEAGLSRIAELVELLVARDIGAVFVESSVSDRNIRALAEGAAAVGHEVVIGGELFSDAMGAPGTYEGTYLGMIDHNATVIARALGGSAPARGMSEMLN
jgi:manganese/zinc/iron transport system substrate-binding protein